MNKNAIISFANSKGNYINGLARLSESLRNNSEGIDFISFIGEASLGCELHINNPYSFKIAAFKKAKEAGYKNILWLDSSCFAIKSVQPIFDKLNESGFVMQDAGHYLGNWASDYSLEYFGISRDEAMSMKCIGNAGLLGLNFDMSHPNIFFNQWEKSCQDGMFKGTWDNKDKSNGDDERIFGHRHDLSCSSAIIHKMELFFLAYSGDKILQYAGVFQETANDTIIIKAEGL